MKSNWKTMKGPGDFDPPEYDEGPECPECGGPMEEHDVGTWKGKPCGTWVCCDEDCEGTYNNEPDWEDIAAERAARYDDFY
jgi:hypothetical protein